MIFRTTAFVFLFCWIATAQPASFEGVAVNAVSQEPLAGVHVRLIGIRNIQAVQFESYGAVTDRAGRFSISPIKPGAYILAPSLRGFLYAQKKEGAIPLPSVTIKSGERLVDFKLAMTPAATIGGRVVDEYGDPVPRVSVQAEPVSSEFVISSAEFSGRPQSASTDDRGIFRLTVLPGKFYVKASPQTTGRAGPPEIRTDGSVLPDYAATYFPSTAAKDAAVAVETRAGAEATGIDIRLAHAAPSRRFGITGSVIGTPENDTNVMVMVQFGEKQGQMSRSWNTGVRRDSGKFVLSNLEPGFYRLSAVSFGGSNPTQGAPVDVKIDGSDIANLELRLTGSGDLGGTVEFAGEPRGASQEKRTIRLMPAGPFSFGVTPSAEIGGDGSFHIDSVPIGKFRIKVDPMPENAYVQSVILDGVASDGLIALQGNRGARAKVTISRNGVQIEGTVRDKNGQALVNSFALVLLVDDVEKLDVNNSGPGDRLAQVTPEGRFSYHAVRPGKYRLLAVDAFHAPDIEKSDILKKTVLPLPEFEVKEGDHITKDVTVVGKEDVDAKSKQ